MLVTSTLFQMLLTEIDCRIVQITSNFFEFIKLEISNLNVFFLRIGIFESVGKKLVGLDTTWYNWTLAHMFRYILNSVGFIKLAELSWIPDISRIEYEIQK